MIDKTLIAALLAATTLMPAIGLSADPTLRPPRGPRPPVTPPPGTALTK